LARQKEQTPGEVTAKVLSILLSRKNSIQLLESQKHCQFQLAVSQQHITIKLSNRGLSWNGVINPY